jgi:hypothetical protein
MNYIVYIPQVFSISDPEKQYLHVEWHTEFRFCPASAFLKQLRCNQLHASSEIVLLLLIFDDYFVMSQGVLDTHLTLGPK